MKKPMITLAAAFIFGVATVLSSCSTVDQKARADQKVESEKDDLRDEKKDVQDAREDVQDAREVANLEAQKLTPDDWKKYQADAEAKIKKNEARIIELRSKIKESGTAMDDSREKKIAELEKQNWDLRTRLNSFDANNGKFDEFKREFDHDMDEIGKGLKDITVDNKK
jgi:hypothetical protein